MTNFRWMAGLVGLLALVACGAPTLQQAQAIDPLKPPSLLDSVCNAEGARFALGQKISSRLVEDAQVRSNALYVRILQVGDPALPERNTQRLNLLLGSDGEVLAIRCR